MPQIMNSRHADRSITDQMRKQKARSNQMDAALIILIVILAAIAILTVWLWSIYNSLVTTRQRVRESWSGIDVRFCQNSGHELISGRIEQGLKLMFMRPTPSIEQSISR